MWLHVFLATVVVAALLVVAPQPAQAAEASPMTLQVQLTGTVYTLHIQTLRGAVDWGDGTVLSYSGSSNPTHTYDAGLVGGSVTIKVGTGTDDTATGFGAGVTTPSGGLVTGVVSWGDIAAKSDFISLNGAFRGETSLTSVPPTLPAYVRSLDRTFEGATSFNDSSVTTWNTGAVTSMANLFANASSFNQNIGSWQTGNVTNMSSMFNNVPTFNQGIGGWDTSKVVSMSFMFVAATSFNQDIGNWSTGHVTNMTYMFYSASAFNRAIGMWNMGSVANISNMFYSATSFNQDLSTWSVGSVTNAVDMFRDSGIKVANYSKILAGWGGQTLKAGVPGSSSGHPIPSRYAGQAAVTGRQAITNAGWTFTDLGPVQVTFNANGGTGTMPNQNAAPENTPLNLLNGRFSRKGYAFMGWSTSAGGAVGYSDGAQITITDDTTLYANWKAAGLTVAKTAAGGPFRWLEQVDWTYTVTNTGDVTVDGIVVTDSKGVTVTCPESSLDKGEQMTCTGSGLLTDGTAG
jgi:uncharacterized repeat protein (TIGR02543 family)